MTITQMEKKKRDWLNRKEAVPSMTDSDWRTLWKMLEKKEK